MRFAFLQFSHQLKSPDKEKQRLCGEFEGDSLVLTRLWPRAYHSSFLLYLAEPKRNPKQEVNRSE
jgi:hypothetical protein